jgi:hypothetical protein
VKAQVFSAVIMAAAGFCLVYPWMVTERFKKMERQREQEAEQETTLEKV